LEIEPKYTADNPSKRWRGLVALYRQMHEEGDGVRSGDKLFVGKPRPALIPPLKALIKSYQAKTLLDYGSGKGMQWQLDFNLGSLWETTETRLKSYLELEEIRCYDPAFQPFSKLPEGDFDGVICLDVLEHCPEQDIAWILDQIFSYARKFVLANIASFPAKKHLPNGENAHCIIKPIEWWRELISETASNHPLVRYRIICAVLEGSGDSLKEIVLEG
jgi:hypothetical protein